MKELADLDHQISIHVDDIHTDTYVWYDSEWHHGEEEHQHESFQLTYVTESINIFISITESTWFLSIMSFGFRAGLLIGQVLNRNQLT